MRLGRRALLGAFGASAAARGAPLFADEGAQPPLIPIATFAEKPAMTDLVLSPDGLRVLARIQVRGKEMLGTYVLATGEFKFFALPEETDLAWFRWAGNDRFLISVSRNAQIRENYSSLITIYGEGRATRLLCFDIASQAAVFIGGKNAGFSGDDVIYVDPAGEYVLMSVSGSFTRSPSIYRFMLKDNKSTLVERDRDGVSQWYADDAGVVRAGVGWSEKGWFFLYRSKPDEALKPIAKGKASMFEQNAIGEMCFVAGTDEGYILASPESGLNAVYKFNFATRAVGEQIFACPTNDVQSLDFGESGHKLEAIRYTDDRDRVAWIDPVMKELQEGIDRAMPGRQNRIVSRSADQDLLLVHSSTPRDPGIYYVFSLATAKLKRLVRPSEKLVPAQLAMTEPVHYPARDGLEIPGYLTLPAGREPKGLPLVIKPHGGPYGVRDTLKYDPVVQFLANRGYAVLQPNYRGSESYGIEFFRRGHGEWGRKMQDDLDDGMDWLVKRGIVDPKRVCLVGGSYGGYAAAWGATRNPERYRCASAFAGVFNLRAQLGYTRDFLYSRMYRQYESSMRGAESFDLDSVSPLTNVDRLKVPIQLIHGDKDTRVPIAQSKSYDAALTKAGKPHEYHLIKGEGHGFVEDGSLAFYLTKLEAFLTAHNPA